MSHTTRLCLMLGIVLILELRGLGLSAVVVAEPPLAAEARIGRADAISIVVDKAPDCRSLKTIVESVTRGCETNDEKAIAIYNFLRLANYHLNYPGEKGGISSLKLINVYGWSLCGGLHTVEASLWREMGWKWRYVGWSNPGHTTVEAFYDGRWHYLDTFLKFYAWTPDERAPGGRTIASQGDIRANPDLVSKALVKDTSRGVYYARNHRFESINDKVNFGAPAFFVCGDTPESVLLGVRNSKVAGSQTGWNGIKFDTGDYSTDVNLSAGSSLTLTWDAVENGHWWNGKRWTPRHSCGDKEYRNCACLGPILEPYRDTSPARGYSNGELRIAPDLKNPACLSSFVDSSNAKHVDGRLVVQKNGSPASITLKLSSPYILTLAHGSSVGADRAEVSVDGGKTFQVISLDDFSIAVQGQYKALVRLTFSKSLSDVELIGTVQCNRCAMPYLSPGPNKVTVAVARPNELDNNELLVTYAYRVGWRRTSYEELADGGYEIGRGHHAEWSNEITVVQKRFTKGQLPATFQVDVLTPKGGYPVYPRMLFLRREVVPPGDEPLPLPEGAIAPKVTVGDELLTLPNPFQVGISKPLRQIVRPTTTRRIALPIRQVIAKNGKVLSQHHLKWKKDSSEAWVLLIGGDIDLPPRKQIAAARLIVPVTAATPQSATKLGVSRLTAAFSLGKRFDFANLGEVSASLTIPQQPGGQPYEPAKAFTIDVSQTLKRHAEHGTSFFGFGLRTIQDRNIDDGWTVRVDVAPSPPIMLEVDVIDGG